MKKLDQMSRRSFFKLFGAASVAGAGLALAGCNGGEQKPAEEKPAEGDEKKDAASEYEPVTLKVAYMPNLGSAGSLFAGISQGYFDEVGITVEPQQFQKGPAEITALQSGEIDVAQIGHGAHSLCVNGDAKVFFFDQLSKADAVVANKAKGIEKAADLKGKNIGIASGTSSEIILQYVLQDAGLTKDDVTLTEMDVAGMTTALISGAIDAAATWSPATITLEQQLGDNYLVLGTNVDYSDKVAFPGSYICANDYADKNNDVLVRFGAAIDKAHVYRAEHTEELAKYIAKELELDEDTMVQSVGEGDWQGAVDVIGDTDTVKGYYEAQQKVFLDGGQVEAEVPVENYVLLDIMKSADELYETKLK